MHAAHPEPFGCERYALSGNAPGCVSDDEMLHFLLTRPGAIDEESGRLLPKAAKQLTEGGLSVLREGALDREFVDTFIEMRKGSEAKGKTRVLLGVSTFRARDARHDEAGVKFLGVFATGLPGRPHHADVAAPPMSKPQVKEAVAHLYNLLQAGREEVPEFRSGALAGIS